MVWNKIKRLGVPLAPESEQLRIINQLNEVQKRVNKLKSFGAINVINSEGVEENITFKIAKELIAKS